ncbi:MAG: NADH-quinone oxidoreductase subunit N [Muribaculaceae bacterium]|nr:NADH-quinone oxidoreductase subunit N [Muribaculaceae bacterium]MEE1298145.1 NADH-quinone oxidoreductase subunit N [Muribaculaceae bacterium]
MDYSQFLNMPQEIGLLVVFLLVFLYDTFMSKKVQNALPVFTCVAFGLFTIANLFFAYEEGTIFGGMFETTQATVAIKAILNIGMLIVLIQSIKWANSEYMTVRRGEFYELLLITLFGMYFMISARHFLMFVIGLETASLPLAALIAFEKNRYESHEAAAKYMFTAIFSSAVFMMGLSFVYALSGSLYFSDIALSVMGEKSTMLIVALAFVIAGVGFKLSLVPFHLWTADVYQGAPTPVTGYLSVISKGSAAFGFMVILVQVFGSVYDMAWEWMLYALIVLTITLGNLFAIRQRNMKRFLAFSSVSQAGYIMLGIISANALGLGSLMYYVLVYVLSNLAAFGVIGAIENKTGKVMMADYNGLRSTNPWLSFAMMLAMFSLAGIPPFAGFFSKFFIFTSALSTGSVALYVLVLIALLNTIISLYYYLLVVKAMFINKPGEEGAIAPFKSACSERLAMIVCVLGIILVGIVSCIYSGLIEAAESSVTMFM